jgi:hypothetical protein
VQCGFLFDTYLITQGKTLDCFLNVSQYLNNAQAIDQQQHQAAEI